jgi:hypothetical protein
MVSAASDTRLFFRRKVRIMPLFRVVEKPPPVYIGIDPGRTGGIAVLTMQPNGKSLLSVELYALENRTVHDVWELFEPYRPPDVRHPTDNERPIFACIEQVGGYMAGSGGNIGSAMFTFGKSAGRLEMALVAAGISYDYVTPAKWQRPMGVTPRDTKRGEKREAYKRRLRARAQQLFPSGSYTGTITLATADALLLAEFCRRKRTGTLESKVKGGKQ